MSIEPDVVSYLDTTLIECSRQQSIQFDDVNRSETDSSNSLFTNNQSYGIQVDEGDKISLNSAYVSEVGAGSEVIEFTGIPTGDTYEVEYTNTSYTSPISISESTAFNPFLLDAADDEFGPPFIRYNGNNNVEFRVENTSNIKKTFNIVDNEINFSVGYYKNTNGENYFHLPRRWTSAISYPDIADMNASMQGSDTDDSQELVLRHLRKSWVGNINGITSRTAGEVDVPTWTRNGHILDIPTYSQRCQDDWQIVSGNLGVRTWEGTDGKQNPGNTRVYKRKNGNERYKIFQRDQTTWFPEQDAKTTFDYKLILDTQQDIALHGFVEYKELKTLNVDVGFDTPSNIATNLTEQLSEILPAQPIKLLVDNGPTTFASNIATELIIGNKNESTLLKAFRATTLSDFNETNSRRYMSGRNASGSVTGSDTYAFNQSTLNWSNSFHNIGVKRPDLFIKGRYLGKQITVKEPIEISSSAVNNIITNIKWEEINPTTQNKYLIDFANFFESQELYPEVFEYGYVENAPNSSYVGIDKSRYIHINTSYTPGTILGCDNWLESASDTAITGAGNISGSSSSPLWIGYIPSQKNNRNFDTNGDNLTNTWGGFAHKFLASDGFEYISFDTAATQSLVNTPDLFDSTNYILAGRCIGFDWHFSAYGTSCIALYNGNTTFGYVDLKDDRATVIDDTRHTSIQQQRDLNGNMILLYDKAPYVYLGSPSPLINFDTTISRFTISGLHSPEYIGNQSGAGGFWDDKPEKADKPDQIVYYINKRMKHNTFCPDMVPYNWSREYGSSASGSTDQYTFPMNENIVPYIEYDTNSGILWETFGSDRKNWNNNSLLGILGFSYDSLNPTTFTNINTRYNATTSKPNTNGITTNGTVIPIDYLARSQNPYGLPVYNNTVSVANQQGYFEDVNIKGGMGYKTLGFSDNLPPIVRDTESSVIRATNLPKKTTRPYYLIRSNIIQQNNFMGGAGAVLPVIGLVDKKNGDADYYTTDGGGVEFTATQSFVISSITTSIHAPNGELATIDGDSSVIYKIVKNKSITTNLSQVVMSNIPSQK